MGIKIKLSDLNFPLVILHLTMPFLRFYIISKGTNRRKKSFISQLLVLLHSMQNVMFIRHATFLLEIFC